MSSRCASRVMSPNAGRGNSSEGLSSHGDKTAAPKLGMRSHTTRLFWKYLLGTQCGWCANERVSSRPSLSYPLLPLSSLPSRPPPSPSQVRLPPSRRHVAISLGSIPGLHFFFFILTSLFRGVLSFSKGLFLHGLSSSSRCTSHPGPFT